MPTPAARQFLARKLFDYAGIAVSVTPIGGTATEITALVEPEETQESPTQPGLAQERQRKVTICRDSSLGFGSVEPQIGMVVTVGSDEYSVKSIDLSNPTLAICSCVRPELSQVARPGFRNGTRRG